MPREFARHLRVAAELKRVLSELLLDEIKDPRLQDVRVTDVELSGDLGVARVFFSMLDPDADPEPVYAALGKAGAFIRARAGRELRLRRVPELRFHHDRSARQGLEISELIREAGRSSGNEDDAEV